MKETKINAAIVHTLGFDNVKQKQIDSKFLILEIDTGFVDIPISNKIFKEIEKIAILKPGSTVKTGRSFTSTILTIHGKETA